MDGEPGLRELKKRRTRIALSRAAVMLSVERGFHNVLVGDIAAQAGVSPRTFNNYFSSKGEAIAARRLERMRSIAAELRERPASEPIWRALTAAAEAGFDMGEGPHAEQVPQHWSAGVRRMVAEPAVLAELLRSDAIGERELAAVVARRTGTHPERDLYPQLVAGAFAVALRSAVAGALAADSPLAAITLLRSALEQVAAGLPAP